MEKLLSEWGCPDLVSVFEEQEIDEEALLCLDLNSLKEMIPKLGPRMKFFAKLIQYQKVMNMPVDITETNDENNDLETSVSSKSSEVLEFVLSSSTPSSYRSSSSIDNINNNPSEIRDAFEHATEKPMAFCGQSMMKRACRNVYHLNLREFLNRTVIGKFILNTYSKENRFTRKMRSQLSYILVSGLMSENSSERLLPVDFDILSEKICKMFPTETKSTYYIPHMPGNKKTKPVNAKGKLIDKYRNLGRLYNLQEDKNDDELNTTQENDSLNNISDIDQLNNCAKWLKTFQEPWDLVVQNCKFALRKIANSSPTVEEYMNEWPILKHKDAHVLIEFDFQQLYPMCPMSSLLNEYQK